MNSGDPLLFFAQGLHLFQAWVGQESGPFVQLAAIIEG